MKLVLLDTERFSSVRPNRRLGSVGEAVQTMYREQGWVRAATLASLSDLLCKSGSSRLYVMFTLQELETVWEVYFDDIERFGPSLGAGPSNPSTGG